jgi:hypothetical protein
LYFPHHSTPSQALRREKKLQFEVILIDDKASATAVYPTPFASFGLASALHFAQEGASLLKIAPPIGDVVQLF